MDHSREKDFTPRKPLQRVTLRDVARRAAVSVGTASKVLSAPDSYTRVSAACRTRIVDAARDLGYTPSFFAKSLREGRRARVLGLVSTESPLRAYDNDQTIYDAHFWAPLREGLISAAHAAGMFLAPIYAADGVSAPLTARAALLEGRIDALMLLGFGKRGPENPSLFTGLSAPVVTIEWPDNAGLPSICLDDAAGACAALDHFAAHGHRAIAWFSHPREANRWALRRSDAVAEHAARLGMTVQALEVPLDAPIGGRRIDVARDAVLAARGLFAKATAALCYDETYAAGLYAAAAQLGWAIPARLSVIAFDDVYAYRFSPPLTALHPPFFAAGTMAVELAVSGLADPQAWRAQPKVERMDPWRLVTRGSVGRAGG
jgi:LacI family transcriptional regulator